MQSVLGIALAIALIAVSLVPALAIAGGATVLLLVAARRFPPATRSRIAALVLAMTTSLACIGWVSFSIYQVYLPVVTRQTGATNGLIILFGPAVLSSFAAAPVAVVWLILRLWLKACENRNA